MHVPGDTADLMMYTHYTLCFTTILHNMQINHFDKMTFPRATLHNSHVKSVHWNLVKLLLSRVYYFVYITFFSAEYKPEFIVPQSTKFGQNAVFNRFKILQKYWIKSIELWTRSALAVFSWECAKYSNTKNVKSLCERCQKIPKSTRGKLWNEQIQPNLPDFTLFGEYFWLVRIWPDLIICKLI